MRIFQLVIVFTLLASSLAQAYEFAFGKRVDTVRVEALLSLSPSKKIQKILSEGVIVEKHAFVDTRIKGQFLDRAHYPDLKTPTIWLAADADEWTVVHEYIHYLMSMQNSPVYIITDRELSEARGRLAVAWKSYEQNQWRYTSEEHREELRRTFAKVTIAQLRQLESFELAEISIETYLRQIYQKLKPSGFTEQAAERSSDYVAQSGRKALARLRELSVNCEDTERTYTREQLSFPQDLNGLCQRIFTLRAELNDVANAAGVRIYTPMGDK